LGLILLQRRHLRIVFHKIRDKSTQSARPRGIDIPVDLLARSWCHSHFDGRATVFI
jgi:hypothetical protein